MKIEIANDDRLISIENKIRGMSTDSSDPGQNLFAARLSSDRRGSYFKDIWISLAIAKGLDICEQANVTAWGIKNWERKDDEDAFALSHACLLAFQRGAAILTETTPPAAASRERYQKLYTSE